MHLVSEPCPHVSGQGFHLRTNGAVQSLYRPLPGVGLCTQVYQAEERRDHRIDVFEAVVKRE